MLGCSKDVIFIGYEVAFYLFIYSLKLISICGGFDLDVKLSRIELPLISGASLLPTLNYYLNLLDGGFELISPATAATGLSKLSGTPPQCRLSKLYKTLHPAKPVKNYA